MTEDPIQRLGEQWRNEVPDLDTAAMVTVARLNQVRTLAMRQVETSMADAGANLATFDVLSALRRQGPPYKMKPSSIARSVMMSPSGMTNRIDQLEEDGLVERVPDPSSRRTAPVALTPAGTALAEQLAHELANTEEQIMSALSAKERKALDQTLAKLAVHLQDDQ